MVSRATPPTEAAAAESTVQTRILGAARKRFEQFGFRRTGVAEIARDAGIAAGTLYRYFRNKEAIFLAVMRQLNAGWITRAHATLSAPGTGAERLERLGHASVALYRENPLLSAVLRRDTELVFAPVLEEMHREIMEQTVELMAGAIRDGVEDGSIRPLDPERAAYSLFVAGQALFSERHRPYGDALPVWFEILGLGLSPRSTSESGT